MCLLKLSLILQIDGLSCIAWLVITEKIVIPKIMMKIKLSLRSVQLVHASALIALVIRKRNINRLIIGQLNINSLKNKFESLVSREILIS